MFDYISVSFPQVDMPPVTVYSAYLYQERYKHEIACLTFKDWGVSYDSIKPGSPVNIKFSGTNSRKNFYGYVHHITPNRSPGKDYAEVTIIGGSYPMKKPSQTIYRDMTADKIVQKIAKSHKFVSYVVPHPRVYEQVAQSGHTDWELLVRLAKQCGYTLRTENTELYFQPLFEDYTKYRAEAPSFFMGDVSKPDGTDIYSFTPLIGESIPYEDGIKAAVAVSGADRFNQAPMKVSKTKRAKKTKLKHRAEFFDRFDTSVVVTDSAIAKYEAEAADNIASAYPYRASVEVIGTPTLRPDLPIFLDGLGNTYSGFWTILKTEHKIVETERNVYTYTTILEVGTDSLGVAQTWTDNKTITVPESKKVRTIIPGVRQTKILPTTSLIKSSVSVSPQITGNFGNITNREAPSTGSVDIIAPVWKSDTTSLEPLIPEVRSPSFVVERLQRAGL